jgi:hypothetical protein
MLFYLADNQPQTLQFSPLPQYLYFISLPFQISEMKIKQQFSALSEI